MTDVTREKFAALMAEIQSLEDLIGEFDVRLRKAVGDPLQDYAVPGLRRQLTDMQRDLAEKRSELQRISDGCGKPRTG